MTFSVTIALAESSLREPARDRLDTEGQEPDMAAEDFMDEREADALFTLLERRLPSAPARDDDGDDVRR